MSNIQVGQRVRVIGNQHAYSKNYDRIGEVTEQNGHIFRVRFEDNDPQDKGLTDTAYAEDLAVVGSPAIVATNVKEKLAAIETLVAEIRTILGR